MHRSTTQRSESPTKRMASHDYSFHSRVCITDFARDVSMQLLSDGLVSRQVPVVNLNKFFRCSIKWPFPMVRPQTGRFLKADEGGIEVGLEVCNPGHEREAPCFVKTLCTLPATAEHTNGNAVCDYQNRWNCNHCSQGYQIYTAKPLLLSRAHRLSHISHVTRLSKAPWLCPIGSVELGAVPVDDFIISLYAAQTEDVCERRVNTGLRTPTPRLSSHRFTPRERCRMPRLRVHRPQHGNKRLNEGRWAGKVGRAT